MRTGRQKEYSNPICKNPQEWSETRSERVGQESLTHNKEKKKKFSAPIESGPKGRENSGRAEVNISPSDQTSARRIKKQTDEESSLCGLGEPKWFQNLILIQKKYQKFQEQKLKVKQTSNSEILKNVQKNIVQ